VRGINVISSGRGGRWKGRGQDADRVFHGLQTFSRPPVGVAGAIRDRNMSRLIEFGKIDRTRLAEWGPGEGTVGGDGGL